MESQTTPDIDHCCVCLDQTAPLVALDALASSTSFNRETGIRPFGQGPDITPCHALPCPASICVCVCVCACVRARAHTTVSIGNRSKTSSPRMVAQHHTAVAGVSPCGVKGRESRCKTQCSCQSDANTTFTVIAAATLVDDHVEFISVSGLLRVSRKHGRKLYPYNIRSSIASITPLLSCEALSSIGAATCPSIDPSIRVVNRT
ncbi:hypothetical protein LY76DRAFT_230126 [Colletotrichum caudatum]|nr:hypothetical protein LY76DRAFT_230126 [Colletotrichum caudatum]